MKLQVHIFGAGAGVLWGISHKLVWVIIVYTTAGTWLTATVFGRRCVSHLPSCRKHA